MVLKAKAISPYLQIFCVDKTIILFTAMNSLFIIFQRLVKLYQNHSDVWPFPEHIGFIQSYEVDY